ncbi:MAG TPA: CBS domain-containing protein, partial [Thermoanaerobaculia bacterium]|nr:CBS domain-containing protein [Thermoanaerobaculia bacterium]
MIPFLASAFCYLAFLLFESFALALDRLSPIKTRGLLEEHPERARILSGPGEMEIIRTTTKVLVQILLLAGLLTVVSGFQALGVEPAWAWGGGVFLAGWLVSEILLLRLGSAWDPERTVARLLPVVTAASWLLLPLAIPIRKIFASRAAPVAPAATEEEVQAYIDVGREEGILEKEEEKLLLSIVDFGDTRVREVMTPRTDIVYIDVASFLTVLADLFVESKYSRIPVVRGSIDTVVGIVHVKDTLES